VGVDTDLFVALPSNPKLFQDSFTHDQCEPIIMGISNGRGEQFHEKQVLARVEGEKGQGFLVVVLPHRADEPQAEVSSWMDGNGVTVTWKGETHHVLLDVKSRIIDEREIRGETSCLVFKTRGSGSAIVSLPAGGECEVFGKNLSSRDPAEWSVTKSEVAQHDAVNLLP